MKQQGNFLLLEKSEFNDWLKKQNVTRSIKKLQVHHTWLPDYSTRKVVKGVGQQDPFKCLEGMRNTHLANGWAMTGQHITVLETGQIGISLDRTLNRIPAGIRGANTGAITVEIIGNFDKGGDMMQEAQKQAITHLYSCLCDKFSIPINTDHIVYHAWYTSKGDRLPDYVAGKSSKTCPGTNFFGDGNTIAAANKTFIPSIKKEYNNLKVVDEIVKTFSKYFEDVDKEYQASSIDACKERGLISGTTTKTFVPNEPITRGEIAVVVNRLVNKIIDGSLKK